MIQQIVSPLMVFGGVLFVAGSLIAYAATPASSTVTFASVMKSLVFGLVLTTAGTGTYLVIDMSRGPDESEIIQTIKENTQERDEAETREGEQPNKVELDTIPKAPSTND